MKNTNTFIALLSSGDFPDSLTHLPDGIVSSAEVPAGLVKSLLILITSRILCMVRHDGIECREDFFPGIIT